jgi:hypothetical protein
MKIIPSDIIKSMEKSFFKPLKPTRRFCHKTRHRTEQYAQYHIMSLERAGALNLGSDEKLVTYHCVHCGYWHIGRSMPTASSFPGSITGFVNKVLMHERSRIFPR